MSKDYNTLIYSDIYHNKVIKLIDTIECSQKEKIKDAATLIKNSIEKGGVLHTFATGHSHIIVEEMFYRTGGLVPVNPIFDPATMLHEGALKSTRIERLSGYAEAIFESVEVKEGEPILIISNSGINLVPVEMAALARRKNMSVIVITSVDISSKLTSRHKSGKKLMDLADIVIDNCVKESDAAVELNTGQCVGALSSIAGIYIAERLVVEVATLFVKENKTPPIFKSANVEGGDEFNKNLVELYKNRIKGLI